MFNVCVNAMVREWLHQTLGEEAACDGLGDRAAEILVDGDQFSLIRRRETAAELFALESIPK